MCTAPASSPTGVEISEVGTTGFVVSWSLPPATDHNGIIRNYTLSITEENTGRRILTTSRTLSQRVESLHPYYNYTCEVAAVTVSAGPFSEPIIVTTAEAGKFIANHSTFLYNLCFHSYSPQWTTNKYCSNVSFFNIHYSDLGHATTS